MGIDLAEPGLRRPRRRRPARLPGGSDLPRRAVGQPRRRAAGDGGDERRRCTSPSAPGVGQHVETSLAQAVINMNAMGWQRVATDAPELPPVVLRPAGAEGHLPGRRRRVAAPVGAVRARVPAGQRGRCRPGGRRRKVVVGGGDYETQRAGPGRGVRRDGARRSPPGPRDEWVRLAAAGEDRRCSRSCRPEEAPARRAAGAPRASIVELDDPEHGPIRQVGHVYAFDGVASPPIRPARGRGDRRRRTSPRRGRPPADRAGDRRRCRPRRWPASSCSTSAWRSPARSDRRSSPTSAPTVIKVTTREFDLTDAIYVGSSHGKQALALDLKHPRGRRSPGG